MKMIIVDLSMKKEIEIEDPKFIPRNGEHIDLGWFPAPVVEDVVYSYVKDLIVVSVR